MGGGESLGQHGGQVDIVGSGHRVDSFARVTLVGLSKNHAMTFNHSGTTHRALTIRSDSYTTLLDATPDGDPLGKRVRVGKVVSRLSRCRDRTTLDVTGNPL